MESYEIMDFLSMENIDHTKYKLQKVTMNHNVNFIGHFFNVDQNEELKKEKKWVFRHPSGELITLKGEDILSIRQA